MEIADFAALNEASVVSEPFQHLLVEHFIKPSALQAVFADLPAMKGRGSFPIGALKLGPSAKATINALESQTFRDIIAQKFNLNLHDAPLMTTLRGNSGSQDGRIHTDSSAKRVTILLYLNPSDGNAWARHEGCLRLLQNNQNIEHYAAEIPPVDGTLLVFPNGPTTWHGHKPFIGQRYVVQMNYMTTSAKAKHEMRRHHWSAFIKRLTKAA